MVTLESAVLAELREVSGKPKLRKKDIMEWSTGTVKVELEETHFYLPSLQINCAVKTAMLGKKNKKSNATERSDNHGDV